MRVQGQEYVKEFWQRCEERISLYGYWPMLKRKQKHSLWLCLPSSRFTWPRKCYFMKLWSAINSALDFIRLKSHSRSSQVTIQLVLYFLSDLESFIYLFHFPSRWFICVWGSPWCWLIYFPSNCHMSGLKNRSSHGLPNIQPCLLVIVLFFTAFDSSSNHNIICFQNRILIAH